MDNTIICVPNATYGSHAAVSSTYRKSSRLLALLCELSSSMSYYDRPTGHGSGTVVADIDVEFGHGLKFEAPVNLINPLANDSQPTAVNNNPVYSFSRYSVFQPTWVRNKPYVNFEVVDFTKRYYNVGDTVYIHLDYFDFYTYYAVSQYVMNLEWVIAFGYTNGSSNQHYLIKATVTENEQPDNPTRTDIYSEFADEVVVIDQEKLKILRNNLKL